MTKIKKDYKIDDIIKLVSNYNNEVVHAGPVNGERVQVTGSSVMGTGMTGEPCKYIWVYYAKLGVSGYANANFLVY